MTSKASAIIAAKLHIKVLLQPMLCLLWVEVQVREIAFIMVMIHLRMIKLSLVESFQVLAFSLDRPADSQRQQP